MTDLDDLFDGPEAPDVPDLDDGDALPRRPRPAIRLALFREIMAGAGVMLPPAFTDLAD